MAALKTGLIKTKKEFLAGWQSDQALTPSADRKQDYAGWQAALNGAFACAQSNKKEA
jgi:glycerol kinase